MASLTDGSPTSLLDLPDTVLSHILTQLAPRHRVSAAVA
eukprot:CAMPEP_0202916518 /NCGR_PEP_ID=MMETSP1392-20130828/68753_1 /ASSEMBLY_ACC=CAM_ASM_000868 /TAXON_ID=225041 /ORGANISM="Chlamydomonas chlamydogama, Strain SAG 11-48b" /LENGTH=38 /DNA_ID= /DNA_START= /DNA_END= /DNA_ORIENTATION=